MCRISLLLLAVSFSSVLSVKIEKPSTPCKINDVKCLTATMDWLVSTTIAGIPAEGIQTMDPLNHNKIEGNLGYLKYKLAKSQVEGIRNCKVRTASLNSNVTVLHLEVMCHRTHMEGEYDIEGKLFSVPIKGVGKYSIDATNFFNTFDINIVYYKQGSNLHTKNGKYTFKNELIGQLDLELTNLDGSKKHLSESAQSILRFAKENAKVFISLIDNPVHSKNIQILMKNLDKRFHSIPITNLIQIDEKSVKLGKL